MSAIEIDEKGNTERDLIFEEKRQKALEKKLGCKFIRINASNPKNGYDLDYEVDNMEAFIEEFKNKKNKTTRKKINKRKRNERKTTKKMREMKDKLKMRKKLEKELKDKNKELKI